uniref:Secreted protein n=1 Tax=Steinernema glaseri TaxID=37863 RepID=A0A1I7YCC4_9BILA
MLIPVFFLSFFDTFLIAKASKLKYHSHSFPRHILDTCAILAKDHRKTPEVYERGPPVVQRPLFATQSVRKEGKRPVEWCPFPREGVI